MSCQATRELEELRRAVAESIRADPETWPDHGNVGLAIAATVALGEIRQADLLRIVKATGRLVAEDRVEAVNVAAGMLREETDPDGIATREALRELAADLGRIRSVLEEMAGRGSGGPAMTRERLSAGRSASDLGPLQ